MLKMKVDIPERFGPQYKPDSPFMRKARLLQSWYRTDVLKQKQFGFGPEKNSKGKYGNILVNGETTGSNFLSTSIFHYVNYTLMKSLLSGKHPLMRVPMCRCIGCPGF